MDWGVGYLHQLPIQWDKLWDASRMTSAFCVLLCAQLTCDRASGKQPKDNPGSPPGTNRVETSPPGRPSSSTKPSVARYNHPLATCDDTTIHLLKTAAKLTRRCCWQPQTTATRLLHMSTPTRRTAVQAWAHTQGFAALHAATHHSSSEQQPCQAQRLARTLTKHNTDTSSFAAPRMHH
jgi:hypothetical protein